MSGLEKLLTRKQAAMWLQDRIQCGSNSWLARLAVVGSGPAYAIVGKKALYRPSDLETWVEERLSSSLSKALVQEVVEVVHQDPDTYETKEYISPEPISLEQETAGETSL